MRPDRELTRVARAVDQVRVARMLAGDRAMAARLARIVEDLSAEAEVLEGIVLHRYVAPQQRPPLRTLGWWLQRPSVRELRRERGLPLPLLDAELDATPPGFTVLSGTELLERGRRTADAA